MSKADELLKKIASLPIGASISIVNSGSRYVTTMSVKEIKDGKPGWRNHQSNNVSPVDCLLTSIELHEAAVRKVK